MKVMRMRMYKLNRSIIGTDERLGVGTIWDEQSGTELSVIYWDNLISALSRSQDDALRFVLAFDRRGHDLVDGGLHNNSKRYGHGPRVRRRLDRIYQLGLWLATSALTLCQPVSARRYIGELWPSRLVATAAEDRLSRHSDLYSSAQHQQAALKHLRQIRTDQVAALMHLEVVSVGAVGP